MITGIDSVFNEKTTELVVLLPIMVIVTIWIQITVSHRIYPIIVSLLTGF